MRFQTILWALIAFTIFSANSCNKEDPNPSVMSSTPAQNAVDIGLNTEIQFAFSEDMDPSTINNSTIQLTNAGNTISGSVSYSNKIATLKPTEKLLENTQYTCTVLNGAESSAGVAMAKAFTLSFTTLAHNDEEAPIINSTSPAKDAKGISRNKKISVVFNEAMSLATINASTFTLKQGTSEVSGNVTYSGTTATFKPAEYLKANTVYTANISKAVKDNAGNPLAANTTWSFTTGGSTAVLNEVALGASANYVILAKTAINNSATSTITGNLGLSPAATSYITGLALVDFTGYATSAQVTGKVYAADMAAPTPTNLTTAVSNMITAYNDAAGRSLPDFLELGTGNIGGMTLGAGLYKWTSTVTIQTDLTLKGDANDVWIFQISGDLSQSAGVAITLSGGAQAKNIFWQVAGEATCGTTSHFEGNILSMTGITFLTGASMNGRALAQTAVILDANIITKL